MGLAQFDKVFLLACGAAGTPFGSALSTVKVAGFLFIVEIKGEFPVVPHSDHPLDRAIAKNFLIHNTDQTLLK